MKAFLILAALAATAFGHSYSQKTLVCNSASLEQTLARILSDPALYATVSTTYASLDRVNTSFQQISADYMASCASLLPQSLEAIDCSDNGSLWQFVQSVSNNKAAAVAKIGTDITDAKCSRFFEDDSKKFVDLISAIEENAATVRQTCGKE